MWRDGCIEGGSSQFVFPLVKGFTVLGLSAAEGVRQRRLKHQQHLRLVIIPSHSVPEEGEGVPNRLPLSRTSTISFSVLQRTSIGIRLCFSK